MPYPVILVGVDGSDGSRRALRWALDEAVRHNCTVEVVTAWPPRGTVGQLDEAEVGEALRRADEAQRHLIENELRAVAHPPTLSYELVEGDAVEVLLRSSAYAELLVIGSHGTDSVRHAMLGSVSEACARLAECPVVVLPASAGARPPDRLPAAAAHGDAG